MRRVPLLALFCAALVSIPITSMAQTTANPSHPIEGSLVGAGRLGISQPVPPTSVPLDASAAFRKESLRHRGPGVALMIVGAAGVVTGLLLEESIITILGAGAGLVGLYIYLR